MTQFFSFYNIGNFFKNPLIRGAFALYPILVYEFKDTKPNGTTNFVLRWHQILPVFSRIWEMFYQGLGNILTRKKMKCQHDDKTDIDTHCEVSHLISSVSLEESFKETFRMFKTQPHKSFSEQNQKEGPLPGSSNLRKNSYNIWAVQFLYFSLGKAVPFAPPPPKSLRNKFIKQYIRKQYLRTIFCVAFKNTCNFECSIYPSENQAQIFRRNGSRAVLTAILHKNATIIYAPKLPTSRRRNNTQGDCGCLTDSNLLSYLRYTEYLKKKSLCKENK